MQGPVSAASRAAPGAAIALLAACAIAPPPPTLEDFGDAEVIRLHINDVRALAGPAVAPRTVGWQDQSYALADGRRVHVATVRPACEMHFEVDANGVVTKRTPVGAACRQP